jgi:hypothetical protein
MILYKKINDLFDTLNRRRRHPAEAIRVNSKDLEVYLSIMKHFVE